METHNPQSYSAANARALIGVSLFFGLLFDYFFYDKIPGIAFPIYCILIVAGLFGLAYFLKKQIRKQVFWLLVPLIFFSAMVFVRSSELLTLLNVAASLLLLLTIAEVSFGEKVKNFLVGDYIKIFLLPFQFIHPLFKTLSTVFSRSGAQRDQKKVSQVVKGVVMAIPFLVVFLLLFSSADLIFQKYVSDFITLDIEPQTIFQSLLVLIATLVFLGAYSYIFREKGDQIAAQKKSTGQSVGHIESSILLGSVNILFFFFILVQVAYLFAGESNISSQGFTYAEYARRGFFELITVALVSLLLLLSTEKYVVKKETDHALGFKLLSTALTVQVIIIMASAFTRLSLYEEAYGFTTLRLYSHAFTLFLAVVFCLLLYKIYRDKRENTFAFRVFISIVLFLAAINFLNPDAFIARRNIERFAATGKLDTDYLSRLSSDAIPDTIKMVTISNEDLRKGFARKLYWRAQNADSPYFSKWQSLNISRMRAEKILHSKMRELEPYKEYQQQNFDSVGR
ncbi:MAG: DUF4173 domain-containing protein [Candidatus Kerfeldbacteria bacterium]|nr:DUF4173 domain-containing protein [Candidatus Kerfeldbacteria bacterium]